MIIDLQKFVASERPFWSELESQLDKLETNPQYQMPLEQLRHFHYLYERTSADLARIMTFSSEPDTRRYLENLVARAYGEIHETRAKQHRFSLLAWFLQTLPQAFRRHGNAFWLSAAVTMAGVIFGGFAMAFDPQSKPAVLPPMFASHLGDPSERVAREEQSAPEWLTGAKGRFSALLMQNNITQSVKALAFGMTFGVGTIIVLFYNGVILGLIAVDYVRAGQTVFLLGWLMPHGVIEIPAFVIAGQSGLILGGALIGWGQRNTVTERLRAISPDLVTLIFGVALLLVWAGFIEAFLSQYHEPVIPYWVKIAFGTVEMVLLTLFLSRPGNRLPRNS
jgi:uncharacterized membrane protein SpoIIM required for sporulation